MAHPLFIAPLERLHIADPALDGSAGLNRAPFNPAEPVVGTDLEAARKFLKRYDRKPTTARNYTKEVERLLLWSINIKRKPMSSLTADDISEFIDFLADPQPAAEWCATQKYPRESDNWRPFIGKPAPASKGGKPKLIAGLSPASRLTAMAVLKSFFEWLVDDYGYLNRNPMRQHKEKRKAIQSENPVDADAKVERFLDEEMWAAFTESIEAMPKNNKADLFKYERAKFLSSMMLFLAPRVSELASSKMGSFRMDGDLLWWHVVGKGDKAAKLPVVDDMRQALMRYRTFLELSPPLPLPNDDQPLLASLRDGHAISDRQINLILDELFEAGAQRLEQKATSFPAGTTEHASYLTRAAKLRSASAHWGRHTSITFQIRSGIDKSLVQRNARHSDSRTTDRYTHEDMQHWHNETQKLHG